ncbi:MAG: DNA translocase FtsK 4TM domain-containing protein [Anaerolineales bacterium]|nr:DNA translocase FtsK 4TM domain-containing protein [Anaerolineales bacterium]
MSKQTLRPPAAEDSRVDLLSLLTRFQPYLRDIAGVSLLALALMTLVALSLPHLAGGLLLRWAETLRRFFGWGSFWFVLVFGLLGFWALKRRAEGESPTGRFWLRLFALEVAAFASLALLAVAGGLDPARAEVGLDGGRVGWGLGELLSLLLGPLGVPLVLGALLGASS